MIRFSPAPGLTFALVIAMAILITLGGWQVKRLHWKTALLAEIALGETLPPEPLNALQAAEQAGKSMAWRKAEVRGRIADEPVRFLYALNNGKPTQRALAPFITDSGLILVVDFGYIDQTPVPDFRLPHFEQPVVLRGIMKPVRRPGALAPANQPGGMWFWPDPPTMLAPFFASPVLEDYMLDLDAPRLYPDWPKPAPAHANLPNNHLDYALTWFGLALAALGIYLGWHVRAGRLGFGVKRT
jgi:surfeit locus 1 family protein